MKPAPFELHRPRDMQSVLALLDAHGMDARLLAGGQSLVPMMNLRLVGFEHLIDLNRVAGLDGVRLDGDWLHIGAMTRQQSLFDQPLIGRHAPLLAAALPHIGHLQTRSRGTVGGSLAHADPSAELPLVMLALQARMSVLSSRGPREIAASDFFEGMMTTGLAHDEVLTGVAIPVAAPGTRVCFREYARRHGDFAIAAAAAQFVPTDGGQLRVALGGVNPTPYFCAALSQAMRAGRSALHALDALIEDECRRLEPMTDNQADAGYRRVLAAVLLNDCVREVLP